jgi:alpha-L-glutamate ligase-like protein
VRGRRGDGWIEASGRQIDRDRLVAHARSIIDGEHTSGRHDAAIVEPLLVSHPSIGEIAPVGLPDIRVIVHRGRPILAMLRIPTVASGGRGNLHQGGIGAAIDLVSGRIVRAVLRGRPVTHHPESGEPIVGSFVPMWRQVMEVSEGVARATGLGYLGADIVVDEALGVAVLEVNSHPGLEIQNVCGVGLGSVLVA